jgi:glycerate 2-kinase
MTASEIAIESLHKTAVDIFLQALDACSIESAFDRRIRFEGSKLHRLIADGAGPSTLELKDYRRIFVVAMGKAAVPMLDTLLTRMGRRKGLRGICCSSGLPEKRNWRIRYFCGGHPLPNEGSFAAARATLALLRKARKDTLVIFLISGGASALFDLPLDPDITLEDAMGFHQALIASGAPITEVNIIRKHFSAVKGGRLAIAAAEAAKLSILLPDVPLRSLDTLASGPTSPDHTTVEEVRAILDKYDLIAKFPARVSAFFNRSDLPESPGNKSRRAPFLPRLPWTDRVDSHATALRKAVSAAMKTEDEAFRDSMFDVLLSSHDLVENARTLAQKAGFHTVVDNSCDDWDYADAARYLMDRFHALRAEHPRCCLISGGEVTVTIDRTPGAGGRNQQFALACALELAKYDGDNAPLPNAPLIVFSAGSDGIDGNTRSAGAIADITTVRRALAFGYKPAQALASFNACPLFTALGDSVVTGPTGHNLRDLRLLISDPDIFHQD